MSEKDLILQMLLKLKAIPKIQSIGFNRIVLSWAPKFIHRASIDRKIVVKQLLHFKLLKSILV